jgi:beta-galactosidase
MALPDEMKVGSEPGTEYVLKVSLVLKVDEKWAAKGHEVAWRQFVLGANPLPEMNLAKAGKCEVESDNDHLGVLGEGFMAIFDEKTGMLTSLSYDGKNMLSEGRGPVVNLFRAPGDNDGYAKGAWAAAGLDRLKHELVTMKVEEAPMTQVTTLVRSNGGGDFY